MRNPVTSYLDNRKLYNSFSGHIRIADHNIHEALDVITSLRIGMAFVGVRNDLLYLLRDGEYKKACKSLYDNQDEAIRASKNLRSIDERVEEIGQRDTIKNIDTVQHNPEKMLLYDYEGEIDKDLPAIEQIIFALNDIKGGFEKVNPFFMDVLDKYVGGLQDSEYNDSAESKRTTYKTNYGEAIEELNRVLQLLEKRKEKS